MNERLEYIRCSRAGRGLRPGRRPAGAARALSRGARVRRRPVRRDARASRQREVEQTSWRRWLPARSAAHWRAARASRNFAALPFPGGAFDLIWSNLALHWHSRPDAVLPEWQRVLRVNGLLMFSTLGPDTLRELRAACADAEAALGTPPAARVIDFVDMHDGDMLVESGFEIPVMEWKC